MSSDFCTSFWMNNSGKSAKADKLLLLDFRRISLKEQELTVLSLLSNAKSHQVTAVAVIKFRKWREYSFCFTLNFDKPKSQAIDC